MISGMVHLSAQKAGNIVSVKIVEGNTIYGKLISSNDSIISLETAELGLLSIRRNRIKKMRPAILRSDGSYWFESPNPTRNLLAPTGFGLRKGAANYQNTMLFFHTINYGITDHISIAGGFELASLLFSSGPIPGIIISPKISTASDKSINVAAGVTIFRHRDNSLNATLIYTATSFGDRDNNFTMGVSFGNIGGRWEKQPMITLSGMGRLSKKFSLVTENWVFLDTDISGGEILIFSFSGRYLAPSITVDFGLFLSFGNVRGPWLGVALPFGG